MVVHLGRVLLALRPVQCHTREAPLAALVVSLHQRERHSQHKRKKDGGLEVDLKHQVPHHREVPCATRGAKQREGGRGEGWSTSDKASVRLPSRMLRQLLRGLLPGSTRGLRPFPTSGTCELPVHGRALSLTGALEVARVPRKHRQRRHRGDVVVVHHRPDVEIRLLLDDVDVHLRDERGEGREVGRQNRYASKQNNDVPHQAPT